jgi:phage terminase Nu1 subunit (DNA packaging protein)
MAYDMDCADVARELKCSTYHVYNLVKQGLPHVRSGRGPKAHLRFDRDEVVAWLRDCGRAKGPELPRRQVTGAGEVYECTEIH